MHFYSLGMLKETVPQDFFLYQFFLLQTVSSGPIRANTDLRLRCGLGNQWYIGPYMYVHTKSIVKLMKVNSYSGLCNQET